MGEDLQAKVEKLSQDVAFLVEREQRRAELWDEMTPILKEAMTRSTEGLQRMDEVGYFDFGRALGHVAERVVQGYTAEDVEALGNSIVAILDTVRAMTQPHVLKVLGEVGDVVESGDDAKPVGVLGALKTATRDEQVQRGMAVMLEVLRHVGQGAEKLDRRQRLQRKLASRTASAAPAPVARRQAAAPAAPVTPQAVPEAPKPSGSVTDAMIGGLPDYPTVLFTPEGFMQDAEQWNKEIAEAIAKRLGLEGLTEDHWAVIEFARKDYAETGASPNIRRITKGSGVDTKRIYGLFPAAPGKCTAMVAGLPKPVGCI